MSAVVGGRGPTVPLDTPINSGDAERTETLEKARQYTTMRNADGNLSPARLDAYLSGHKVSGADVDNPDLAAQTSGQARGCDCTWLAIAALIAVFAACTFVVVVAAMAPVTAGTIAAMTGGALVGGAAAVAAIILIMCKCCCPFSRLSSSGGSSGAGAIDDTAMPGATTSTNRDKTAVDDPDDL